MDQLHLSDMALFVEVARCGSYRAAAKRLDVPVATLSRRISAMEKRLACQLLVRTTRSVSLAAKAEPYYVQCLKVLEAAEAANAVLPTALDLPQRMRISMPVDLGVTILGPVIADFAREMPQLRLAFDLSTRAVDLFREPVDLVFRIGNPMDEQVVARQIAEIDAGIFVAPSLLRALGPLSDASALQRAPCLELMTAAGPMPWRLNDQAWARAPGVTRFTVNNMGLLLQLAVAGHGVALLPRHLAVSDVAEGRLLVLDQLGEVKPWPLYAVSASRELSPVARKLIEFVRATLASRA